jgi:hypothetical protein
MNFLKESQDESAERKGNAHAIFHVLTRNRRGSSAAAQI